MDIDIIKLKTDVDSSKYKMIKCLLNSKYFNRLSHKNFIINVSSEDSNKEKDKQKETAWVEHESCALNKFEYSSLIFENSIKNGHVIANGINLCNNGGFDSPLNVLVQSKCNTIRLEMFFNGLYKYASNCQQQENISKCCIKDKYLHTVIANIDVLNRCSKYKYRLNACQINTNRKRRSNSKTHWRQKNKIEKKCAIKKENTKSKSKNWRKGEHRKSNLNYIKTYHITSRLTYYHNPKIVPQNVLKICAHHTNEIWKS